ncbi:MAG: thiolase family protein [Myxococcota bacterium]
MREVAVVSAVRTPVGKAKRGVFKDTRPDDLLAAALSAAVERSGVDPAKVDDVVVGTAMPEAEQGMNVARIGAFMAGVPDDVPALTINRFCSSGLQSLAQGAASIIAGWQDVVLAGGVESMTLIDMGGEKPAPNPKLLEERPGAYTPMGITAENVANRFEVSREAQDQFAATSQQRAIAAIEQGKFKDEIVPVQTRIFKDGTWHDITVDTDEGPRASTVEGLGKLRPAFKAGGSVTAGNSSQMSDGAAAVIIAGKDVAEQNGWPILALLKSYQVVGVDPEIMGIGPARAIPKALEAAGLKIEDVGLFEIKGYR